MAWLEAEVTWSVHEGEPPLTVEGGAVEDGEVPAARFEGTRGALVIPAGGPALRCHALVYVLHVGGGPGGPVAVELAAREAGEWRASASFQLPGPGTYLGLVALEKKPRTIEGVRVTLEGAARVGIYDLALLTFG
jgi:hypothetical protein